MRKMLMILSLCVGLSLAACNGGGQGSPPPEPPVGPIEVEPVEQSNRTEDPAPPSIKMVVVGKETDTVPRGSRAIESALTAIRSRMGRATRFEVYDAAMVFEESEKELGNDAKIIEACQDARDPALDMTVIVSLDLSVSYKKAESVYDLETGTTTIYGISYGLTPSITARMVQCQTKRVVNVEKTSDRDTYLLLPADCEWDCILRRKEVVDATRGLGTEAAGELMDTLSRADLNLGTRYS